MRLRNLFMAIASSVPVLLCLHDSAAVAESLTKVAPKKDGYTAIISFGAPKPASRAIEHARTEALPAAKVTPYEPVKVQSAAKSAPKSAVAVRTHRKTASAAKVVAPVEKVAPVPGLEVVTVAKENSADKAASQPFVNVVPVARPKIDREVATVSAAPGEASPTANTKPVARPETVDAANVEATAAVLPPSQETTAAIPQRSSRSLPSLELRSALHTSLPGQPGLRGALETALRRDAEWGAALMDVKVADREVWRELLRFTPVISGSLQANRSAATGGSRSFDLTNRENYVSVSAQLPLWTSGARYYGVKAAQSRRETMAFDAMAVRDQATMKLIETWMQTVTDQMDREFSLDAIKRLKRLKSAVIARRKAGFASSSDVAQVDADIAAAAQSLSSIEGSLAKNRAKLIRLSGQKPGTAADLARFDRYLDDGKQAFVESAHSNNPQLRAAASRYRTEIYSTRSATSRLLPSVSLTGEYRHYLDNGRISSGSEGLSVGIRLQVPLIDLSAVADTAAQSARKEAALYREVATLNAVETEIDDLWNDRIATVAMRAEVDREVSARKKSVAAARDRFEKGFGLLEDAIRAETALLESQRSALQFAAQESLIATRLLVISGRFDVSMLGDV